MSFPWEWEHPMLLPIQLSVGSQTYLQVSNTLMKNWKHKFYEKWNLWGDAHQFERKTYCLWVRINLNNFLNYNSQWKNNGNYHLPKIYIKRAFPRWIGDKGSRVFCQMHLLSHTMRKKSKKLSTTSGKIHY